MYLPEMPDSPHVVLAGEPLPLRYEDVCQDGRLMPIGMPHALTCVWRACVREHDLFGARDQGILPILAQLWVRGFDQRIHVGKPARSEGRGVLAHVRNAAGEVDRIVLDMRATIYGTVGSVLGPQPEGAGEEAVVGEVFARHVFTKLFAPPGQRRVRALAHGNLPEVPPTEVAWHEASELLGAPENATMLDAEAVPAHAPLFGLQHTDSNQHVNSLAYPRVFEQVAQERFAEHVKAGNKSCESAMVAREVAVNFRRPFFAGQRPSISVQAFTHEGGRGALGAFSVSEGKVHCDIQMRFR